MKTTIRLRLSAMMFLQFFVWGSWYVAMGPYLGHLGFSDRAIGLMYSTTGWAAIVSPFFVGLVADRFFAAQHILCIAHLLGGLCLLAVSYVTTPGLFFGALLAHTLCYMPTLSLTNAIGFAHLEDPGRDFPAVRVWGTLGWIVAGLTVSFVLAGMLKIDVPETTCYPLRLGAIASLVMGLFALSLPPTPPQAAGQKVTVRAILGLDTLSLLRDRSFALFAISSLLICIPLSFYYAFAGKFLADSGMTNIAGKMTLGQVSEIFFMLVMPFFFKRLGVKRMLLAGMLCWVLRYLLFATGNSSSLVGLLYLGILLHGICYDFFFVTGQIYIEQRAPESLRASAQGFITFITLGLGMVIGTQLSGWIAGTYTRVNETGQTVNRWPAIWLIPALMALIVAIVFAFGFKPPKNKDGR